MFSQTLFGVKTASDAQTDTLGESREDSTMNSQHVSELVRNTL
jgi:hypothetical protein